MLMLMNVKNADNNEDKGAEETFLSEVKSQV